MKIVQQLLFLLALAVASVRPSSGYCQVTRTPEFQAVLDDIGASFDAWDCEHGFAEHVQGEWCVMSTTQAQKAAAKETCEAAGGQVIQYAELEQCSASGEGEPAEVER